MLLLFHVNAFTKIASYFFSVPVFTFCCLSDCLTVGLLLHAVYVCDYLTWCCLSRASEVSFFLSWCFCLKVIATAILYILSWMYRIAGHNGTYSCIAGASCSRPIQVLRVYSHPWKQMLLYMEETGVWNCSVRYTAQPIGAAASLCRDLELGCPSLPLPCYEKAKHRLKKYWSESCPDVCAVFGSSAPQKIDSKGALEVMTSAFLKEYVGFWCSGIRASHSFCCLNRWPALLSRVCLELHMCRSGNSVHCTQR